MSYSSIRRAAGPKARRGKCHHRAGAWKRAIKLRRRDDDDDPPPCPIGARLKPRDGDGGAAIVILDHVLA